MSNMSYCRFENTYNDLLECQQELEANSIRDIELNANEYEKPYIRKLIALCKEIADDYYDEIEEE